MKKLFVVLAVLGMVSPAFANCGNDNGNGNGCSNDGTPGPQGPTGPQGPVGSTGANGNNGLSGSNGTNGVDGKDGKNGTNGKDGRDTSYSFRGTDLTLDAAVRLLDTQYVQLQAYNVYVFGSHPGDDVFGNGHNSTIGARILIKLGSSYEEREIARLRKQLGLR